MPSKSRRRWILPLIFLAAAAVIGFGMVEGLHWWRNVDEPNALVQVDFTLLSASVNATVGAVHVRRGERVEKGALLASMDTAVAALDAATLEAEAAGKRASRAQVEAEQARYAQEMNDKIATAREAVKLQRRERAIWERRRAIAQGNVERNRKLASRRAISERQLDDAADRLLDITAKLRSLETDIQTNRKKLQELNSALNMEAVFRRRIDAIDRAIDKIGVQLRQSRQRLADMDIRAPIGGIVDEVYISAGVYVEDGDRAFLLHDPEALWLEARIDEGDIGLIRPGQPVTIEFDAYPFEYVEGKVRAIGDATLGSMTQGGVAADPRLNQRIPVLIDLPTMARTIRPGMRAGVNIKVR